jgi:hypothetical protein
MYVIKFHAICESNSFKLLYMNVISRLDNFINADVH